MYNTEVKAERLLADASKGATHLQQLFTQFGCHAFAFSRALNKNGEAILMTQVYRPKGGPEKCTHAWCDVGGKCYDYFGEIDSEELLLKRFLSQPGFSPPWETGVRAHVVARLDTKLVQSILSGSGKLPPGYYSDSDWITRSVALADTIP